MRNVAHIGLGKTATTTLQKHVFPKLADNLNYKFNDGKLWNLLRKSTFVPLSDIERQEIGDLLQSKSNLVSLESLVCWNPALWEETANRNLEILGKSTKILITLREPRSWMTSVYQQQIQIGNVSKPENFFLPLDKYKVAAHFSGRGKLEYFCPDYVDFEKLVNIYRERFETVVSVNLDQMGEMHFLPKLFDISEECRANMSTVFKSAKRENRAYSQFAMSATLKRETFLNLFDTKSIGTSGINFEQLERLWSPRLVDSGGAENSTPKENKVRRLIKKNSWEILKSIVPSWRKTIQSLVDKIVPYRKYSLPNYVYLNEELLVKNNRFLKRCGNAKTDDILKKIKH